MIDGHVHLENGELSKEYVYKFVESAKEKGITHLQILDHTHRFFEFKDCYQKVCEVSPLQKVWFEKKQKNYIQEYLNLIQELKADNQDIKLTFGLEVCYTPETEYVLKEILSKYDFDFLVGSVHSIDGYLYDMDAFSKELLWNKRSPKEIYEKYFNSLSKLIQSNLFTQVGHPDVIKMYQIDPQYDLRDTYKKLAKLAKNHNILMEDNTGAHYRYHHPDVGLNKDFRNILLENDVKIITASDAHYPEHVGKDFELLKKD
jgi:histidinol-phosphatase (PHP family)